VNGGELAAGIDGDRECYTLDGPSVTPRGSRTVAATRRDEETLQVEKRDGSWEREIHDDGHKPPEA